MPTSHTLSARRPVMSAPARRTLPESGCIAPAIRLKHVVLPAPFGPISATIPFSGTLNDTSATARRPRKLLERR